MSRLIRIDDFPSGRPNFHTATSMEIITIIAEIFNRRKVSFILGITPMYTTPADLQQLKKVLPPYGRGVMHGFTHGFPGPVEGWEHMKDTWPDGGEFAGMNAKEISRLYNWAFGYFTHWLGDAFGIGDFIPPFNCYTQELLDVLNKSSLVKRIHTCNKEYKAYGYGAFDYGIIEPVISEYRTTYHDIHKIDLNNPAQITLHWMFDAKREGWQERYEQFAKAVA